jgi:hypothetical protein
MEENMPKKFQFNPDEHSIKYGESDTLPSPLNIYIYDHDIVYEKGEEIAVTFTGSGGVKAISCKATDYREVKCDVVEIDDDAMGSYEVTVRPTREPSDETKRTVSQKDAFTVGRTGIPSSEFIKSQLER